MCNPFSLRLFGLGLGVTLAACSGGGLTLPEDGRPARLVAFSGQDQEGTVGSRLDDPLVALLTDASGQPVPGVPVEFQFDQSVPEAEVDPTTTTTDEQGLASAEVRLGTSAGTQTVEARVLQSSELRATFEVTAVAPESDEDEEGKRDKGGKGKGKPDRDRDDHDDDDDDDDDDA
ncbi:MAG: Ig-like domain-containing protein [Gemmatimonadales bacterium]